jgi:peptidoglycan/LPS O-acetylase OafA/YrhL
MQPTLIKSIQVWNPQYKSLDHWRGIAVLWVLLFHGFGTTYKISLHPIVETIKAIAAPGWLGVHFFFVISGYCISASVYRLNQKQEGASVFLKQRFWRLVPTYWLALLFTVGLNLISMPFNKVPLDTVLPSSWQIWISNILLIQPYLGAASYVVVYWTLVVEIGFYLITAGLMVVCDQVGLKPALMLGLFLGIVSALLPPSFKVIGAIGLWCEFLCGVLLFGALLAKAQNRVFQHRFMLLLIVLLGMLGVWVDQTLQTKDVWFSALFAIALYLLYPLDRKIASFKWLKWLQVAGLMSYSLYLLHVPIQGRIINLGSRFIHPESISFLLLQMLGWGAAIAASYWFYRTVEKPLNQWRYRQRSVSYQKT